MQLNLQDAYLGQLKKENLVSVVYLVNGFQLKGLIKGFDNFTVFLENEGKIQMVYKHSITTINPVKSIHLAFLSEAFKGVTGAAKEGVGVAAKKDEAPAGALVSSGTRDV
jgi:host factor-I protein